MANKFNYKFKVGDRVLYEGNKATIVALKSTNFTPYYSIELDKNKQGHYPAYEEELTLIKESKIRQLIEAAHRKCEMAWKVYSYNPEKDNELVDTSKAFDCIAAAQAHKRDILEKNPNYTVEIIAEAIAKARIDIGNDDIDDAYMDINYAISRDTNYKLKDFKKESSQKNEDFYKYIDDVPTREIAKALKELGIKEPYATQKAKIADKLAKHFGLRSVPTSIEMVPILNALPYFKESAQINETRGYTVTVELGVPDNMNNRDIEDEVERLLRASNKINVVMDVTAERK